MESTLVDQRKEVRTDLSWPVSMWIPQANRFFNGRSVNVSKGGAYLTVPLTTPVRPGQEIELNFPRTTHLAQQKGQYARIKSGKVLRVDRSRVMQEAVLGLAVQFTQDQE
jgi:hypothetical protein